MAVKANQLLTRLIIRSESREDASNLLVEFSAVSIGPVLEQPV